MEVTENFNGLTTKEAEELLKINGYNELPRKITPKWLIFLNLLRKPMACMLWLAAIIEIAIQQWLDMGLLLLIQFVNASISFYETTKAADAVDALASSRPEFVNVLRDGKWSELNQRELVVGDIVRLRAGVLVPADCEIVKGAVDIDQSTFNGESLPKAFSPGMLSFMSTVVVRGESEAIVRKTGKNTEIGTTAELLNQASTESNLQKVITRITLYLVLLSITLCLIVLIYLNSRDIDFVTNLSFVVVLLVASVPLAIEIVTTTTLALGARELTKHGAIVTRLTAIEDLSAMSVLCSDKTGTLTLNKMKLQANDSVCFNHSVEENDEFLKYRRDTPLESVHNDEAKTTDNIAPAEIELTVLPEPGAEGKEPETLGSPKAVLDDDSNSHINQVHHVIRLAALCINFAEIRPDPLDEMVVDAILPIENQYIRSRYEQTQFIPFDSAVKRVSSVVKDRWTGNSTLITKGAVEVLMQFVNDEEMKKQIFSIVERLGRRGIRSIGLATTPDGLDEPKWTFHGLLAFLDPPRPDTKATLESAKANGIAVKMITGDSLLIAQETARVLDLSFIPGTEALIFPGNDLPHLVEEVKDGKSRKVVPKDLVKTHGAVIAAADGFAGVHPEHKFIVVKGLQDLGYRVGMTGDGVNDAAALKNSDVGIAVQGAVPAAQRSAEIVLTKPGLSTIIVAIVVARRIFRQISNFFIYRIGATLQLIMFFFISVFVFNPSDYQPPICSQLSANATGIACTTDTTVWPPFFHLPVLMLMLITLLNDGTLISIGYDKVKERTIPERWNMKVLFFISFLMASVACCSSLLLLWMELDSWRVSSVFQHIGIGGVPFAQITNSIYLKVSISDFLTLFSARTNEKPFWSMAPAPILLGAACLALSVSTILGITWPDSTSDEVETGGLDKGSTRLLPLYIWIYCVVFWIFQDQCKVVTFSLLKRFNIFGINDTGMFELDDAAKAVRPGAQGADMLKKSSTSSPSPSPSHRSPAASPVASPVGSPTAQQQPIKQEIEA